MASDHSDRDMGIQAVYGQLKDVPADLQSKALLNDRWAIEMQQNGCSSEFLKGHTDTCNADYTALGLSVMWVRSANGYILMGDLKGLQTAIEDGKINEPFYMFDSLYASMEETRAQMRGRSRES